MRYVIAALILAIAAPAHADNGERWDGLTIAGQTAGGIGGGLVGGALGLGIGVGLGAGLGGKDDWGAGLAGGALGAAAGCIVGVTMGVKLAGDAKDGTGSWGGTAVGATIGAVITIGTLPQYVDKIPDGVAIGLATVTMIAPPILGYHLTADDSPTTERRVMVPLMVTIF